MLITPDYIRFASFILPDSIRLSLLILLDELFLIRPLVRCLNMLSPIRTPLYNLLTFVHSKVVSVFS